MEDFVDMAFDVIKKKNKGQASILRPSFNLHPKKKQIKPPIHRHWKKTTIFNYFRHIFAALDQNKH